jgi:MFS family permease
MSAPHDPYAALRYRDYRHLLSGGVLASIGGEVQALAVGWELWERTHDALMLGLAGLTQFLPVLLLALPAGHTADHFNRKRIFQAAQATMMLASLGLALLSLLHGPVPLIFLCLLLGGVSRSFTAPARSALLALIVPPESLGNAVTWNSSGWQIANVTGPAIGGVVFALWGPAAAYLLAAGCSLSCVLLLVSIQPRPAAKATGGRSLAALLAGARFVWRTELLLAAITLDLFAVLLGGATALLPIFADRLGFGPIGLGFLRAAPAIGALVMALVLAHRPPLRQAGPTLLAAVAGFGVATIVFGFSDNYGLSFAMLAVTGALDNISVVVRGTLMQMLTPDEMRGRVAAVNTIFISSSNELGAFESGVTAAWFGPVASVVGGGVGTVLVVLIVLLRWPQLLRLGSLHAVGQQEPAREPEPVEASVEDPPSPRLPMP